MFNNRSLEDIQAAFKAKTNSGNSDYYPFHLIPTDSQAIVRFLPDVNPENPMGFLVEKVVHKLAINGNIKKIPCIYEMFGEDCPICAVSQRYYKAQDKVNGKKYWKNRMYIAQALVISDPMPPDPETGETHEGKLRFISLGWQLYGIIKAAFERGDLEQRPHAFQGGYNFIIQKKQQGEFNTYTLGSDFARRQTDLTEEQVAYAQEHMVDLSTLLPQHPGLEVVEAQLNAALTGAEYNESALPEDSDSSDDYVPPPVEDNVVTQSQNTVSTTPPAQASPNPGGGQNSDDILAKIRQKRRNAAVG